MDILLKNRSVTTNKQDRTRLQEAGRRKLEEFRQRRAAQGDDSATKGRRPLPGPVYDGSETDCPPKVPASALAPIAIPDSQSAARASSSPTPTTPPGWQPSSSMGAEDPADAMVTVLMHQVANLMKEKQALLDENGTLRRDNEALQELVGFLSGELDDENGFDDVEGESYDPPGDHH
mmetsp:Transcript_36823/g.70551  ORF Transcript_36823/g.70551 Transcript_36823/m.70551 type:complete len:177 (-) Transcript_36823:678-1208(-)|eukprot:CAMPEP_0114226964 /NCGR_PEP_ID=MMETSP0058-20121206/1527_1 /TAXON_ID=36894 /ORGANISM="Pyramimonas parkeae, CCMP726" /LENGTH=176 /DNA_ID=CAMNT_0001337753 /DNA_START=121 /DNA_END=651 /DNA_ORIENTATION=-